MTVVIPFSGGNFVAQLFADSEDPTRVILMAANHNEWPRLEHPILPLAIAELPHPCWLALRIDTSRRLWAELWASDPRAGGTPVARINGPSLDDSHWIADVGAALGNTTWTGPDSTSSYPIVLDDLIWTSGSTGELPPYPFGSRGAIALTGGGRGSIAYG